MPPLIIPVIICLLVGMALALRFKFVVLLPATVIILLATCAVMIGREYSSWAITFLLIVEATTLQVGYVGGSILLEFSRRCYRRARHGLA